MQADAVVFTARHRAGAAALVLAQGHVAADGLLVELRDEGRREVCAVGDCLAPRTVEEAVLEGLRVGSQL